MSKKSKKSTPLSVSPNNQKLLVEDVAYYVIHNLPSPFSSAEKMTDFLQETETWANLPEMQVLMQDPFELGTAYSRFISEETLPADLVTTDVVIERAKWFKHYLGKAFENHLLTQLGILRNRLRTEKNHKQLAEVAYFEEYVRRMSEQRKHLLFVASGLLQELVVAPVRNYMQFSGEIFLAIQAYNESHPQQTLPALGSAIYLLELEKGADWQKKCRRHPLLAQFLAEKQIREIGAINRSLPDTNHIIFDTEFITPISELLLSNQASGWAKVSEYLLNALENPETFAVLKQRLVEYYASDLYSTDPAEQYVAIILTALMKSAEARLLEKQKSTLMTLIALESIKVSARIKVHQTAEETPAIEN